MSNREIRKSTRDTSEKRQRREEAKRKLKEINYLSAAYHEVIGELDKKMDAS